MNFYVKVTKYITVLVISIFIFPVFAHADYVYNNKRFDSFEEMQKYIVAYMEAWREVYGDADVDIQSASAVARSTNRADVETTFTRDVTYASARFVGKIHLRDSERVRVWFDYGLQPNHLTMRTKTEVIGELYGIDTFDTKAISLLPETTYYYRAGAIDENGFVDYGEVKRFTTAIDTDHSNAKIDVRTNYAREVDDTHAILQGYIDFNKESIGYVWFQYGDDEDDLYKRSPLQKAYKVAGRYVTATIQRLDEDQTYYYRFIGMDENSNLSYGKIRNFTTRKDVDDEAPEAETKRPVETSSYSATLTGSVDMNDFRDGVVFFVYGEDRNDVAEVEDDYDTYSEIHERGDRRQKVLLDSDLDRFGTYEKSVSYLDPSTYYYYAIGVAYEDENNDETIELGRIYTVRTKRDNN